jgi:hypothetical protein
MGMLGEFLSYLRFLVAFAIEQSVKGRQGGGNCHVLSQLSSADKSTPWRPAEKARTVLSSVAGNTLT